MVRRVMMVVLLALAGWQAWRDWQATIGAGYAYRLTSIDQALAEALPGSHASLVRAWQAAPVPWMWDPVGTTFLGLPLAMVLALLAALIWMSLPRARGRG
jgi:hypothetical protein